MVPKRSLTVFCPLGLSNRLRVLLSGLALAEATGCRFQMLWPLTPACTAPFTDLFANDWPVQTVDAAAVTDLLYISGWFDHLPDVLAASQPDLVIGHPTWLIRSGKYPGHDRLMSRCEELFVELAPIPAILENADTFRQRHFQPTMIGVHLRRGDLLRQRPDVAGNTVQAVSAVEEFLGRRPEAGVFLCTDDGAVDPKTGRPTGKEHVIAGFRRHFGARVVSTSPRSLDRRTPEAIQDALLDLWLLRGTECLVGTRGSSFSEMALFARDIPHLLVAGATPGYQRLERWARRLGVYAMLADHSRQRTGESALFPVLLRYHATAPYRWARRIVRGHP